MIYKIKICITACLLCAYAGTLNAATTCSRFNVRNLSGSSMASYIPHCTSGSTFDWGPSSSSPASEATSTCTACDNGSPIVGETLGGDSNCSNTYTRKVCPSTCQAKAIAYDEDAEQCADGDELITYRFGNVEYQECSSGCADGYNELYATAESKDCSNTISYMVCTQDECVTDSDCPYYGDFSGVYSNGQTCRGYNPYCEDGSCFGFRDEECFCAKGWYGDNENCTKCPNADGMTATTKSYGSTTISQCYVTGSGNDVSGQFTITNYCYYSAK